MGSWKSILGIGIGAAAVAAAALIVVFPGEQRPAAAQDLLISVEELRDLHAEGAIPGAVSLPTESLNRTVVLDDGIEVPRIVQEALHSDTVLVCNALSAQSYEEGSIEGSTNLHATSLFEDGEGPYFRGDEVLDELLEDAGFEVGQEFLSFCGSGYMASINYFAARLLGIELVRMYDGSLVDW